MCKVHRDTYFPADEECTSMELLLVDPCVFLCIAQLIMGDFLIGFFHRCLLGALCTSRKIKIKKKNLELKIK